MNSERRQLRALRGRLRRSAPARRDRPEHLCAQPAGRARAALGDRAPHPRVPRLRAGRSAAMPTTISSRMTWTAMWRWSHAPWRRICATTAITAGVRIWASRSAVIGTAETLRTGDVSTLLLLDSTHGNPQGRPGPAGRRHALRPLLLPARAEVGAGQRPRDRVCRRDGRRRQAAGRGAVDRCPRWRRQWPDLCRLAAGRDHRRRRGRQQLGPRYLAKRSRCRRSSSAM